MGKPCQYGPLSALSPQLACRRPATTKRLRPNGEATWDVCEAHAAFLDRLRANIVKHAELLRKLAER